MNALSTINHLVEQYVETPAQAAAVQKLSDEGFNFSNWIPAHPDADSNPDPDHPQGTVVLVKSKRFSHEYREVDPEGNVN